VIRRSARDGRNNFIRWFEDVGLADVPLIGGKNASAAVKVVRRISPIIQVINNIVVAQDTSQRDLNAPHDIG
jgi:hypothetical protein